MKKPDILSSFFRIGLLGITPVLPHILMLEPFIVVLCSETSCPYVLYINWNADRRLFAISLNLCKPKATS